MNTLPQKFEIRLFSSATVIAKVTVFPRFSWFRRGLDVYRNPDPELNEEVPLNILVFGPAGSGKSAWLNTVFTLFNHTESKLGCRYVSGPDISLVNVSAFR